MNERLMRCGLTNLEIRITRGDHIEVCKILTGKESIPAHKFFEISTKNRTIDSMGTRLYRPIKNKLGPGGIDFSVRGW